MLCVQPHQVFVRSGFPETCCLVSFSQEVGAQATSASPASSSGKKQAYIPAEIFDRESPKQPWSPRLMSPATAVSLEPGKVVKASSSWENGAQYLLGTPFWHLSQELEGSNLTCEPEGRERELLMEQHPAEVGYCIGSLCAGNTPASLEWCLTSP